MAQMTQDSKTHPVEVTVTSAPATADFPPEYTPSQPMLSSPALVPADGDSNTSEKSLLLMSQGPLQMSQGPPQQCAVAHAIPLYALTRSVAPVDCPFCGQRGLTKVDYRPGFVTHGLAAFLCFTAFLATPVPYFFKATKDVKHQCGHCNALLATWHRSGGVELHTLTA